ncbi:MAG: MBL fold metallo-hydrolase [Acidobacteria bacterium]|nr:MBL fold metallo-hydrolase [Acidobacteriota bacterium]
MSLRDEMLAARHEPGLRAWWLGQSGFLIHSGGHYLLIDPYLSDSLTKKYAQTDKPHIRICPLVIQPSELDFIDVVTSSHNHTDHLDADTLIPLRAANPALAFVLPEANRAFASLRLGCDPAWPSGLNDGQQKQIGPFVFHAVAAAHEQLDPTPDGLHPYLGYVIGINGYTIYHPGDCVLYPELPAKLKRFSIDLAFLPINGSLPERRVAGNFWGREAAWLARETGIRLAVPCHYEMFEFNSATPAEFIEHCRQLGQPHSILQVGQSLHLPPQAP